MGSVPPLAAPASQMGPFHVPTLKLMIQLPSNAPGRAAKRAPNAWDSGFGVGPALNIVLIWKMKQLIEDVLFSVIQKQAIFYKI